MFSTSIYLSDPWVLCVLENLMSNFLCCITGIISSDVNISSNELQKENQRNIYHKKNCVCVSEMALIIWTSDSQLLKLLNI